MKTICKLAKTELQILFYSPVAWLIMIVFTFQAALAFTDSFSGLIRSQDLGSTINGMTRWLFISPWRGIFPPIQEYLYLYIPLLTMGLMSRELGSGSIKLLYSSPITNLQIILGKFLSMMIYGLILIGILFIFVLFAASTVKDFDFPAILSGLLGLYLLICAYAAIGLFMSSLTSYQVVAAMLTLAMLAILNCINNVGQGIELIREITYWLAIAGRADTFIVGLICSEDVLYFIIVVALFLSLAVIRLQACRQKTPWVVVCTRYLGVVFLACFLGFFSSRPSLMSFYDATATKSNTLTPNSQDVIKRLEGGLTITTYVNALDEKDIWTAIPRQIKNDQARFKQYVRFKPEIKLKYVYYYDTINDPSLDERYPNMNTYQRAKELMKHYDLDSTLYISPQEIRAHIDLFPEGNRFVRLLERETGEKTFLRVYNDMMHHPSEREITAAFKRLVMKLPKVGFLKGHGERDINKIGDRDYGFANDKAYRQALINQGFDVEEVSLDKEIPSDITILVIAELRTAINPEEMVFLNQYIERGGNMLIMAEPKRDIFMNPLLNILGVNMIPGTLVHASNDYSPDLIATIPTEQAMQVAYGFEGMRKVEAVAVMPSVAGLEYVGNNNYTVIPLFQTDSLVWNETRTVDFVDDTVRLEPELGEVQKTYFTALALQREIGNKTQKIIIYGDADCISNGEVNMRRRGFESSNYTIIMGSFYWLSDNEVPIDIRRPTLPDNKVYMTKEMMNIWQLIFVWILPGILLAIFLVLEIRRRGR